MADDDPFAPIFTSIDDLCRPIAPSVEVGSGPVLKGAHRRLLAALAAVEAGATMLRAVAERSPRCDGKFEDIAGMLVHDLAAAGEAVEMFRAVRDCRGEG